MKSFDPPGVPVLQPAVAADLLAQATDDAPLPALSDHLELDVELLFTPGRQVRILDESLTTEVQPVGTLTTSGVLATAGRTNVALRLRLTDRPTVEHRVAEFADGSRRDLGRRRERRPRGRGALVGADAQRVEVACQEHIPSLIEGRHAEFGLGGADVDTVMVASGFGDGGYPCYWGLDADGGLAELVVDFVVLAEDITRTTTVPFAIGTVDEPGLGSLDFRIAEAEGGYVVSHRGTSYVPWRVLSPEGVVVVEHNRLGSFASAGVSSSTWTPDEAPPPGSVLEVTEHLGYRHV